MAETVLTLNAGSSSLKFSLFAAAAEPQLLRRGQIGGLGATAEFRATDAAGRSVARRSWSAAQALSHADAIVFLLDWLATAAAAGEHRLLAAGHRVVHGGARLTLPIRVDPAVLAELRSLVPLAPLHQPQNIAAIEAVAAWAPSLPQVACFDTAFHHTQPAAARAFAIPRSLTQAGVQRYGFHGLSYEYVAGALGTVDPRAAAGRTIIAHLGHGASLCAILAGHSIATTMGLTALDGLVMGTRCGAMDPGAVLHLCRHSGLSLDALERTLYEQSGLLGVSGISADMKTLLTTPDPRAREAIDLFVYRAAREIGSLAAALGGLDALVFTGGIGENAPLIREAIAVASLWLGVEIDTAANETGGPRISPPGARVAVWVIPTNEELMIARHTVGVFAGPAAPPTGAAPARALHTTEGMRDVRH